MALLVCLAGCAGSSKNTPAVSTGGAQAPCAQQDAGTGQEDPARKFLEIETCPAEGQRVKGDNR